MFLEIFWFDFKRHLKRPGTWLFFAGFFIFAAVYIASLGGLIPGGKSDVIVNLNSARSCAYTLNGLINNSLVGTIVLITLIGPAIQKDFQYNSHSVYFTKPISKFDYVMGRFLSGYMVSLLVISGTLFAFILMCHLPLYAPGKVGSYGLWTYLQGFIYLLIPNTLIVGTFFFSIVTLTRNLIAGYVTNIALLMALNNSTLVPADIDSLAISLKDPYGTAAIAEMTEDWTPTMENNLPLSFSGYLLYNRIFWLTLSGLLFWITYRRFSFQQSESRITWISKRKDAKPESQSNPVAKTSPVIKSIFNAGLSLKQWLSLTRLELKNLVKSPYFLVILLLPTIIFIIDGDREIAGGKANLPTTVRMIDAILNLFKGYINIIIIFYSGALVWRETSSKISDMVSSTPVNTGVLMFSKVASLTGMYLVITIYFTVFFVFFQLAKGYTAIEPMVYIQYLIGYNMFNIIIIACFAVCIQAIVNNRYLGYLICILAMLFVPMALDRLGIANELVRFNSGNRFIFSAMDGAASQFSSFLSYKVYWLAFVGMLLTSADLLWVRSAEHGVKSRLRFARNNLTKSHLIVFVLSLFCLVVFGSLIS